MAFKVLQFNIDVNTRGRGTYGLTGDINRLISDADIETGTAQVFTHHTSASLIITENADPDVRRDLDTFMRDLVPDGDRRYLHQDEGPDDMPAHVRSVLTQAGVSFPVTAGRAGLGTWQGVFLWEHRTSPHRRTVTLTLMGETKS